MKLVQLLVAALLLVFAGSVYAAKPSPVLEQNVDGNGDIKVAVQNTPANPIPVDVQGTIDANISGGSVEAEITSGEIDVNIKEMPAFDYSRYQLVGFSSGKIEGGYGVLLMSEMCQTDYGPFARMCNTVEALETIFIPDLPAENAWIRPVIVGDGRIDASGRYAKNGDPRHLSCNGWSGQPEGAAGDLEGMIISGGSWAGEIRDGDCSNSSSVACCAPIILAPPSIPAD